MRLGEALALCPSLVLVEADPQGVEREWEEILRRLEDAGSRSRRRRRLRLLRDARRRAALRRRRAGAEARARGGRPTVGCAESARQSGSSRRSLRLTSRGPVRLLVVSDERTREFLAPLPLDLLPLAEEQQQELKELGVRKLGELAGLPGGAVAERLGPDGRRAWSLARGGGRPTRAADAVHRGARRAARVSRRRSATS
jgi:protein ImuB